MNEIYETAKKYFDLGLCVIPVIRKTGDIDVSKVPSVEWKQYQTTRPDDGQLKQWFNGRPANLALIGGEISGNVLWLDFDDQDAYHEWSIEYPVVANVAPTQSTGKGFHVGVKTSYPSPRSQDLFYNGVHIGETRGEGGYIIAAPSVHGSGRLYEWIRAPWEFDFPVIDDLADIGLMTEKASPNVGKRATGIADTNGRVRDEKSPKVQKTLETMLGRLATSTAKQNRNNRLYKAAFTLAGFIQSGELSRNEIERMLTPVALAVGLNERETLATINSGLTAGEARPLDVAPVVIDTPPPDTTPAVDVESTPNLLGFLAADEGNAQAFILLHGDKYLFTNELGWLRYNGKCWYAKGAEERLNRAIIETLIQRRAQAVTANLEKFVKAAKPDAYNVRNCKFMLQSILWSALDDFDNDPDLLNCNNGVVSLQTGEITPHNHNQKFTYCIETEYDQNADDGQWAGWLYSTVTPADCDDDGRYADLAAWLQMAVGYSLTGHTHEQCLFFLQGPPRAGKGVLLQTLNKLLSRPLSAGCDFDTFTAKRKPDNQNFDLAGLKSCRLITASESERTTMLNAKRVKGITGNDPVYCAHKGKDFFSYTPQYKIWLASNFRVTAQADDLGLWSRLRIIHFPNSHLGKEDFGLEKRLWKERKGILKWAIEGAISWYQRKEKNVGLGKPAIIEDAVSAHRNENDTVAQFVENSCIIAQEVFVTGAVLTHEYREFCSENGLSPLGGRRLGESLRRKGYTYKAKLIGGKTKKCWFGIGLEV